MTFVQVIFYVWEAILTIRQNLYLQRLAEEEEQRIAEEEEQVDVVPDVRQREREGKKREKESERERERKREGGESEGEGREREGERGRGKGNCGREGRVRGRQGDYRKQSML